MKFLTTLFAVLCLSVSAAVGSTLDFSTSDFISTFPELRDPPSQVSVTQGGVTFTVTALDARGTDGFRQSFDDAGLSFGVPGNGMFALQIVANRDITLTSLTGEDRSVGNPFDETIINGPQLFDVSAGGTQILDDAFFSSNGSSISLNDTALSAGSAFLFAVDFDALIGESFRVEAVLGSLDFEVSAVPLPAGLPLLVGGFALLAGLRRRKRGPA